MTLPAPTPLYFGAPGAELFGWMHDAPEGSSSAFGLLVCSPFGFDEICAHRSLMHLAAASAAAGIPTLRFDYAGSGDSCGDEFEPERLSAWVRSIHQAADQLKSASGLQRICMVGIRLGATLAALAAVERDDVDGLIAVAPVVRGRDYIRELRILGQATATESSKSRTGDELLESAGFVLTRETVQALQAVNLRTLTKAPAPHVLIVERDDVPSPTDWPNDLTQLGASVRVEAWPGYGAIMTNPQDAVVPQLIIDGVLSTLAQWQSDARTITHRGASIGASSIRIDVAQPGATATIDETIVRIDTGSSALFGIVSTPIEPAAGAAPAQRPAVLLLNSGSVHHIGPNRLWVTLARRWAARGFTVLRLDLSGIGDSAARSGRPENVVYSAEAAHDIAVALAWLRQQNGVGHCHLLGLCSGAFHAMKAAVAGQPIVSSLIVNPLTYSWDDCGQLGDALNDYEIVELSARYRKQFLSVDPWVRLLRGKLDLKMISGVIMRRLQDSAERSLVRLKQLSGTPPETELETEIAAAMRHKVQLKFVFAEGDPGHELMRRQSGRSFDDLLRQHREMSINLIPHANHTFTQLDSRERLIALLDTLLPPAFTSDRANLSSTAAAAADTVGAPPVRKCA